MLQPNFTLCVLRLFWIFLGCHIQDGVLYFIQSSSVSKQGKFSRAKKVAEKISDGVLHFCERVDTHLPHDLLIITLKLPVSSLTPMIKTS